MKRRSTTLLGLLLILLGAACQGQSSGDPFTNGPIDGKLDGNGIEQRVLQSFFLPHDDTISVELQLIQAVIDSRKADSNAYNDGENPYRIRYAVYNLRNESVTRALLTARQSGVDVQILIEADQLDPARDWNTMDDLLVQNGFEFVSNHRDLTAETRQSADLIGVTGSGLMHLKTRLFRYRDSDGQTVERLMTGSMNPGDMAIHNDETIYLIDDTTLIARYNEKFEAVRDHRKLTNRWDNNSGLNVLFTPDNGIQPKDKLIEWIDAENEAILIAVYAFRTFDNSTGRSMVQALIDAHNRGVSVILVTDHKHVDGVDVNGNKVSSDDPIEDTLRQAGIPVYEATNSSTEFTAMHMKMALFGFSAIKVVSDAGNWTKSALGSGSRSPKNTESYLFINSSKLDANRSGLEHLSAWLRLIRTYHEQSPNSDEKRYADLYSTLIQHPAWPQIDLLISANGETEWGENLALTGNHPLLGSWGQSGAPLALFTDGDSYPQWQSSEALRLPFGFELELKLVKLGSDGRIVAWQPGDNRRLTVNPFARHTDGLLLQRSSSEMQIQLNFN